MKRIVLILLVSVSALLFYMRPTSAQTDTCALLKAEADALLAQAEKASSPDAAKALKDSAQVYSAPCTKQFSDDALVMLWGYDAATPGELERSLAYGGPVFPEKFGGPAGGGWVVVGVGQDAYFQGTVPALPQRAQGAHMRTALFIPNRLMFPYQGQSFPVYAVSIGDRTRALPMVQTHRTSADFLDPVTGQTLNWAGKWRDLPPIIDPSVAEDFSMRVRLDTPQSFISLLTGEEPYVGVQMSANGIVLIDKSSSSEAATATEGSPATPFATESATPIGTVVPGAWHTLRLLVQANHMQVFLDNVSVAEAALHNFDWNRTLGVFGFATSTKPDTVSVDDMQVKSNVAAQK